MSDPVLTPEQVEDVRLAKAFEIIDGPEFPVVEMSEEARDALCASLEALRAQVSILTEKLAIYVDAFNRLHAWAEQSVSALKAHRCDDPTCETPGQLSAMGHVLATIQAEWQGLPQVPR